MAEHGWSSEDMRHAVNLGGYYLEAGLRDFDEWSAQMVAEAGDEIRPYLRLVWEEANRQLEEAYRTEGASASSEVSDRTPSSEAYGEPWERPEAALNGTGSEEDRSTAWGFRPGDWQGPRANWLVRAGTALATVAFAVVSWVVMLLGLLGGTVVLIWLAILGDWVSIGVGIFAGVVMPYGYTLASLPAMGLGFVTLTLAQSRARLLAVPFGFLTALWNSLLVAAWVIWVFSYAGRRAEGQSHWPYLLWAYTTAMAPLSYMARAEPPENTATSMALLYAVVCYVICALWFLFGAASMPWLWTILAFGVGFAVLGAAQILWSIVAERRETASTRGRGGISA